MAAGASIDATNWARHYRNWPTGPRRANGDARAHSERRRPIRDRRDAGERAAGDAVPADGGRGIIGLRVPLSGVPTSAAVLLQRSDPTLRHLLSVAVDGHGGRRCRI